jgi:hypothetical protein
MTFEAKALADAFPAKAISWRAQSVSTKNPEAPKAMALAYIDARDVMNRLDEVCGPEGWEDSYVETALGRVICTIRVKCGDQWVSKSDGAGKTDVEGDKGGISDAFKRAAVKWGIGRYLYDMPTPWVGCELYNGKWSKWTPAGLAELERIAKGVAPVVIDPKAKINDTQRDWLIGHAEASVGVAELLKHYGKTTMKDFTVGELEPARDWLKSPTEKAA